MSSSPSHPPQKILLTGANGLVGRAIRPALEKNFSLKLTDRAGAGSSEPGWEYGDLTDYSQTASLMKGVDAAVHLAIASSHAYSGPAMSPGAGLSPYDEAMLDVNIKGTAHLFEAARRTNVRKVVFLSSLTVCYGNRHKDRYSEHDQPDPQNFYACTKLFGENLGLIYARDHGLSVICLRIGQPYPSHTALDDAWKASKRARSTYIAMDDIAGAVRAALVAPVSFGVYNIVSASDNPRFDISASKEIGYIPRSYFSDQGLTYSDSGEFPAFVGKVVTQ